MCLKMDVQTEWKPMGKKNHGS